MLYPVLCQSIISFEPRTNEIICASRSVGIAGGFYEMIVSSVGMD